MYTTGNKKNFLKYFILLALVISAIIGIKTIVNKGADAADAIKNYQNISQRATDRTNEYIDDLDRVFEHLGYETEYDRRPTCPECNFKNYSTSNYCCKCGTVLEGVNQ